MSSATLATTLVEIRIFMSVNPLVNARDHYRCGHHDGGADFTTVVDNHHAFFDHDAGSRQKPDDTGTVGVHVIRADALCVRNGSGDRAFHVGDLTEIPLAVVVAQDDTDHRLGESPWRRACSLNLNAIIAAHRGRAALFPVSLVAIALIICADEPRAANDHRRDHGGRDYPSCSSHKPSLLKSANASRVVRG